MKQSLQPGLSKTMSIAIGLDRTIDFMGEEGRVYATPMLVRDIEQTCRGLLLEHADPGEDSVGMDISLRHLAPTLLGMTVEITAKVMAVEGRTRTDQRRDARAVRRRREQDLRTPQGQGRAARRHPQRLKRI